MRAGLLKDICYFNYISKNKDEFGSFQNTTTPPIKVRCNVKHIQGNKIEDAKEIFLNYSIIVTVRINPNLNTPTTISYKNDEFEIVDIDNTKRDSLIYICKRKNK